MATANLSVGINTKPAHEALKKLKDEMANIKAAIPVTIDPKSVSSALSGVKIKVTIDTADLASQFRRAAQDGLSGLKLGGGSIDTAQIKAGIDQIKQYMANATNDPAMGNALANGIKKGTPKAVTEAREAGKRAGKAFAEGEEEGARTAKISYRFKQGAGSVSISEKTDYTAEQVKARAEAEALDKANLVTQKEKNKLVLQRIDLMRAEFEARKRNNAEELKARAVSNASRIDPRTLLGLPSRDEMKGIGASIAAQFREGAKVEELRASAASRVDPRTLLGLPSRDEMKGIGASIAAQFREGAKVEALRGASNRSRVDPATLLGIQASGLSAKSSASAFLASEAAVMGPSGAELVAMKAKYDALQNTEKAVKKVGAAHDEATGKTKTHAAAMRDAHSAARGLASGMGMMWLTWGNIAPLLAGASLSHGFMQAMKAGTEFAYQLTFVKALGGETAESVRGIGNAAIEMSKSGLYGPVELANGLRTLNQAGIKTKDAMMALPQVFDLATVGEMSMSDAAITLAGVMTAFNLQVKDMAHIGDVFAKAAAESQTSVEQMTQAMKTASVVGDQYGASMEDTATALTLLAKMNITGTAAGTSLRNMLKELYSPTEKAASIMKNLGLQAQTATGELKPFPDVIFSLKGKLEQFNKASQVKILQGLFGERGAKEAIAMLSQTRDEWDKLNKTISESGGFMAKVSAELEATTKGSFKKAVNTLQVTLVEAFQSSEGAAGQLAIKLQQTFNSESFKSAVNGIVTGMLGLTNTLVAMGPVLAAAAAGWVALRAVVVAEAVWALAATAITNVTMTLKAFTLVATGAATAAGGATGLAAALRMVLGPFGLVLSAVTAVTAALGYLYHRMNDYGPAQAAAQNANTAAAAMENLANKTRAATAELRRQRIEKEGGTEVGQSLSIVQKAESDRKDTKALLDSLNEAQRTGGISLERGFMISSLTSSLRKQDEALTKLRKNYGEAAVEFKEGLRERSKIATLDSEEGLRGMPATNLKPSQVAAKKTAEGTAEWLRKNTEFIIENYGEQAAYILDRVTKNLNEQVQDAKIATGTKNYEVGGGGGGGGRASREAAKLENSVIQDLEKRYQAELKTVDAYYAKLEKIESTSAQYGIKTKEEAESKITALTEEHWTKRLEKVSTMSDEMSALLGKSVKLSEADAQKAKTFVATAQEEINTLKEKIEWIKEEARLKAEGAEVRFNKNLRDAADELDKEQAARRQKIYGGAEDPISRARSEGELAAELKYTKLRTEAEEELRIARLGGDKDAIESAQRRRDIVLETIAQQKVALADLFETDTRYMQSAEYGWNQFWTKYYENAVTAAKVVEQSMDSVTKHLENAISEVIETGRLDWKKLVSAIAADLGKIAAKGLISDIAGLLSTSKKGAGGSAVGALTSIASAYGTTVGSQQTSMLAAQEAGMGGGEGGIISGVVGALKSFWDSLTGATKATAESTASTLKDIVQLGVKTTTETSATAAVGTLATSAAAASAALQALAASSAATSGASTATSVASVVAAAAANGAVFDRNLSYFATGGVVNSPTLFRFADGTGMMGEAGPEAIMPLARDSQGRLGVRYEGREAPQQSGRAVSVQPTQNNLRIVNAFDTSVVGDYMGSSDGEKVILNVIRRNQGAVSRMVSS